MTGSSTNVVDGPRDSDCMETQQDCTAQLDQFTYLLFTACPAKAHAAFLSTLIQVAMP